MENLLVIMRFGDGYGDDSMVNKFDTVEEAARFAWKEVASLEDATEEDRRMVRNKLALTQIYYLPSSGISYKVAGITFEIARDWHRVDGNLVHARCHLCGKIVKIPVTIWDVAKLAHGASIPDLLPKLLPEQRAMLQAHIRPHSKRQFCLDCWYQYG